MLQGRRSATVDGARVWAAHRSKHRTNVKTETSDAQRSCALLSHARDVECDTHKGSSPSRSAYSAGLRCTPGAAQVRRPCAYPSPSTDAHRLAVQRLRILQEKKNAMAKVARREIATLLERGKIETARIKVEGIINEDVYLELLELMELYCELLISRFALLDLRHVSVSHFSFIDSEPVQRARTRSIRRRGRKCAHTRRTAHRAQRSVHPIHSSP